MLVELQSPLTPLLIRHAQVICQEADEVCSCADIVVTEGRAAVQDPSVFTRVRSINKQSKFEKFTADVSLDCGYDVHQNTVPGPDVFENLTA